MLSVCGVWDSRFFSMANLIASWSEDQSRKVGCVIVDQSNEVMATGFNGLPRGVKSLPERHSRVGQQKYMWYEHAERNAIYGLARVGLSGAGCRMYLNSYPCADCARAIIQAGIKDLRTFEFDSGDKYFSEHFSVATEMLGEAGVNVLLFSREDAEISARYKVFDEAVKGKNNWFR